MESVSEITLRAMEPEDLELIFRIENDSEFWRYGTSSVPYSRWTLRRFIETSANDLFVDQQVRLVIQGKDSTGNPVSLGLADLVNFSPRHHRAEISLAILPEFQGLHIGERVVHELENYAHSMGLHQLYAIIAVTNLPATRLFQRMGYDSSTLLKDWLFSDDKFVDAHVWQKQV